MNGRRRALERNGSAHGMGNEGGEDVWIGKFHIIATMYTADVAIHRCVLANFSQFSCCLSLVLRLHNGANNAGCRRYSWFASNASWCRPLRLCTEGCQPPRRKYIHTHAHKHTQTHTNTQYIENVDRWEQACVDLPTVICYLQCRFYTLWAISTRIHALRPKLCYPMYLCMY